MATTFFYSKRSTFKSYTLAIVIFLTALGLRFLLLPIESGHAFITFYPAIVIGFFWCQPRAGMLLVMLSTIAANYFFMAPYFSFTHTLHDDAALTIFLFASYLTYHVTKQHHQFAEQLQILEADAVRHYRQSPVMSYSVDVEGKILKVSNLWCTTLGYSREEVKGKAFVDFLAEKSRHEAAMFSQSGQCHQIPLQILTADKQTLDVLLSMVSDYNKDGQVTRSWCVLIDVTERNLLERKMTAYAEQIEDLYNNAPCGYHSLDENGMFVFINETELNWLGVKREEVIGKMNITDFLTPAATETFTKSYPQFMADASIEDVELELLSKKGNSIYVSVSATSIKDSQGKFIRSRSVLYNITELKKIEQALQLENKKNKLLLSTASDGIHILDIQGNVSEFSDSFATMLGYSHQETASLNVVDWDAQIPKDELIPLLHNLIENGQTFETKHRRKDGTVIDVEINAKGIELAGNHYLYASSRDITDRKQNERHRQETEERLSLATLNNGVGIWDWNLKTNDLVWDDSMFALYGMRREDFSGGLDAWEKSLHPDDSERANQEVQAALSCKKPFNSEFRVRYPNGEVHFIKAVAKVFFDDDGQPYRMLGTNIDISELKIADIRLKAALKEKEVLLKEVYHRVKNNLQVVSSLINLQSRNISDALTKDLLRQSSDRIKSMAILHEKLYQSKDLAKIDFNVYAHDLVDNLISSYSIAPHKIKVNLKIDNLSLDVDTAIPCGLIINELVSNALKHAFPEEREGVVNIRLTSRQDQLELIVEDNGIGFQSGQDLKKSSSLGLKLVNVLVSQLSGNIVMMNTGGTSFSVTLPNTSNKN